MSRLSSGALATLLFATALAFGQTSTPLIPVDPWVVQNDSTSTANPTVTTAPGSATFTLGSATYTISLKAPATVTGKEVGFYLQLTTPPNFTFSHSIGGFNSAQSSLTDVGCLLFGGPGFTNSSPNTLNCPVSKLSLITIHGTASQAGVELIANVQLGTGKVSAEYDVHFQWSTAPSCAEVDFDHMEVVQVVQDVNNSIPLVQGKPAVARMFLKISNPPQQPVTGITGVLRRLVSGSDSGDTPVKALAGPMTLQNVVQRDQINQSLNFELPASWIAGGSLELEGEATVPACTGTTSTIKITGGTKVNFQNLRKGGRTTFSVAWVPYHYVQGGAPVACPNNRATCPDESLIPAWDYFLKKLYPIAPDGVNFFPLDIPSQNIEPIKDSNEFLAKLSKLYLSSEARFYDHLVAVTPPVATLAGKSEGIPGRVALISQLNVQNRSLPLENPANETHYNADSVAHEIGHLLGRTHTNNRVCTAVGQPSGDKAAKYESLGELYTDWPYATADVQEVGFDVAAKKVVPANYGDLMSYCSNLGVQEGLSPHTYNKLIAVGLDAKTAGANAVSPSPHAVTAAAATAQVIVSGSARSDGSAGTLDPVYQVLSADDPPTSTAGGTHCLHFSGTTGALGDFCFNLFFVDSESGDALDPQHFAFKVPLPTGTTRISLVSGNKELAALSAKSQPPTLTITSPKTGDQWAGGGQRTITWSSADPSGGSLVYSVLYSSDAGQSWLPLAMDLTDAQFTFDPSQIKGGANVLFRVMTSSGLNSTSADVGPINVVQTPAIAASDSKLNFAIQTIGDSPTQTVMLSNTGSGPLTVSALQIDNPAFVLVAPTSGLKIRAGSSAAVSVQWLSTVAGPASGNLTVSSDDPAKRTISIALAGIGPASGGGIAVTPAALDFGVVAVGQRSAAQNVTLKNTGATAVTVNLSANAPFAVSPASLSVPANGTATAAVTFAPTTSTASTGTLLITTGSQSSLVGFVSLAGAPGASTPAGSVPQIAAVANAASFLPKLSRGALGTVFGSNFTTSAPASAESVPLPTVLNGVSVTVGGVRAPLIYAAAGQINFEVPYEVPAGGTSVIVLTNGTASAPMSITIADYAVGIFQYARTADALDPIIVHSASNALVTPSSPAMPNEVLVIYATGIGKLNSPPATGAGATGLSGAVDAAGITVGGVAAKVLYAGLTPGYPGLAQFNVQLPASLPSGNLPVVITFPGDSSPAVNLAIQGNVASSPSISISATSLSFGSVTVGQTKDASLVVGNSGTATLSVTSIAVTGSGFTLRTPSSFTVAPGSSQTVTVRFAPASAASLTGTMAIASNDPARASVTVPLSGTGVQPATVIVSDSFNRTNTTACSLGQADLALGGFGTHFYLPIFPGTTGPIGANIVSGALQNNGQDFGGVQLTGSAGACANLGLRGETLPQDLDISVDLQVPKSGSNITVAGPYFRSRAASAGDGIIGGSSAGYWVQLASTGEVRVQGLNPGALLASSGAPASFDSTATHTLQIAVQGSSLQVALDGNVLSFTQNGASITTLNLPASSGTNNGTVGLAFGAPDNRGLAGSQRAKNFVVTGYSALVH